MGDEKNDQKVDEGKHTNFSSNHSGHTGHHSMTKDASEAN